MKTVVAKVLDATHLELSQPLPIQPGESIQISIPEKDEDEQAWRVTAKQRFLEAYDDSDDIYDEL